MIDRAIHICESHRFLFAIDLERTPIYILLVGLREVDQDAIAIGTVVQVAEHLVDAVLVKLHEILELHQDFLGIYYEIIAFCLVFELHERALDIQGFLLNGDLAVNAVGQSFQVDPQELLVVVFGIVGIQRIQVEVCRLNDLW